MLLLVYLLPAIIAFSRRHPNRWVILVINVAGGVTLFGWLLAIVWACRAIHKTDQVGGSDGGESGLNLFVNDEKTVRVVGHTNFTSQLSDLKRLLDSGAITQQEFDQLKIKIIAVGIQ